MMSYDEFNNTPTEIWVSLWDCLVHQAFQKLEVQSSSWLRQRLTTWKESLNNTELNKTKTQYPISISKMTLRNKSLPYRHLYNCDDDDDDDDEDEDDDDDGDD